MSLADDFADLRAAGKSDEEILNGYRKFDPQYDNDISDLIKAGKKPKEILDGLGKYHAQKPPEDPMANKSVVDKALGALGYGASEVASGLSESAKQAGQQGTATSYLDAAAKATATKDYVPAAKGLYDKNKGLLDRAGYLPRYLLEGLPGLAADLSGGAVGAVAGGPAGSIAGFTAVNAARSAGNNIREIAESNGRQQADSTDKLKGLALSGGEALLSRLGLGPAVGGMAKGAGMAAVKDLGLGIAKGAAGDAAGSMAGDALHQTVVDGTIDPDRLLTSGAAGAVQGGTVRLAHGASDVNAAVKFRDIDPEAGNRLANRIQETGVDLQNEKSSYEALDKVKSRLDAEIADGSKKIKDQLKSLDEAKGGTDDTGVLLKQAHIDLQKGHVVDPEIITSLKKRLGDYSEGQALATALEDHNTLNQLKGKGNWNDTKQKFGAGMSNGLVGEVLNPLGKYGRVLDAGGLALAMSHAGEKFIDTATLGKAAAIQAGAYAGVRGLDHILGNTNVAGQFASRFAGKGEAPSAEPPPSFRQELASRDDAKQALLAQQASDKMRELQVQRAFAEKSKQDTQAQQAEGQQDKLWNQREITPEQKAAQEEAMWAQKAKQEPAPAPTPETPDWSDHQAQQAIRDATLQRVAENLANAQKIASAKKKLEQNKANEEARTQRDENGQLQQISRDWKIKSRIRRNSQDAEAPQARIASEAADRPTVSQEVQAAKARVKIEKKTEEPKSEGKAEEAPATKTHKVTHGRHVIEGSDVVNPGAWGRAVRKRLEVRDNVEREMKNAVPKKDHKVIEGLVDKWNSSSTKSYTEAYHAMEDAFNDHFTNSDHLGKLYDIFNKHESALRTTWNK